MIVFTNGCFDILHPGHVKLLQTARALGSKLIVGINSDDSVRRIKGPERPIFIAAERRAMLLALECVDEVHIFEESTPERLVKEISPDVLVKGGDWKENEIVGADFVKANGGKVVSIPLVDGYSSSSILERLGPNKADAPELSSNTIARSLSQHLKVLAEISDVYSSSIDECYQILIKTLNSDGKIMICGNGGSAADAQHIAAELVGRFETDRRALPAIALTTDTSALTALANDYDFRRVFARQVDALAQKGDCLIAISTSGESENIIEAVMTARRIGCSVIGMTGSKGKKLASLCDSCLIVPSDRTSRVQEAHITVAHIWCEMVDELFLTLAANQ
ncbi:MAG: D-glycero-beta-D-manno-heptose 1-phosphate adenylyltransferase [Pyrinomonadaceae bacterium]